MKRNQRSEYLCICGKRRPREHTFSHTTLLVKTSSPHPSHSLPHNFFAICSFCFTVFQLAHLKKMADWGPVLIGVVLFILLQPGLLFQLPGNTKQLEFGSMKTNGKAIAVHTLIFFTIYAILILAVHIHIYTG